MDPPPPFKTSPARAPCPSLRCRCPLSHVPPLDLLHSARVQSVSSDLPPQSSSRPTPQSPAFFDQVHAELSAAVLHSWGQARVTLMSHAGAATAFATHCQREREAGRECPAQWSAIAGLAGPTSPLWQCEMRDFAQSPHFYTCCKHWLTTDMTEPVSPRSHQV